MKKSELKVGDKAPDFNLVDQDGKPVALKDYAGRKLLVYFYPKASTPGCTTQACSIRDAFADLKDLGVAVVGISPDQPDALKKFAAKYSLNFTLLADSEKKAAADYFVLGEKSMFGKTSVGIIRSSFLVGEDGRVLQAWYKVKPEQTVPFAVDFVKGLKR
ncbi:MAG: thioredoxin-dependent thiol peroxidase [Candidatus Riflebacteria bacterium GWC2_50_8]|nr:MAG: thioredoxin-dependent thiol peroxidase [Candidatus Riflebacteria bacterium GWC2_50_8]